ncbi:LysM peptidoglycan-binding domain-containing protein [Thermovorax subterraneus]|nr:LysM peptidoglycan-binding domain-containing protein [Thermovorax subterraneus]
MSLNDIPDPNRIFPRKMLLLPPGAQLPGVPQGFFRYTIRRGDTLYSIEEDFGPPSVP